MTIIVDYKFKKNLSLLVNAFIYKEFRQESILRAQYDKREQKREKSNIVIKRDVKEGTNEAS